MAVQSDCNCVSVTSQFNFAERKYVAGFLLCLPQCVEVVRQECRDIPVMPSKSSKKLSDVAAIPEVV